VKTFCHLVFIAAICCIGSGCHRTPPPQTSPVGRFELRYFDNTIVVFDTETARIYVLATNHTFIVRDPVSETERPQHSHTVSKPVSSFGSNNEPAPFSFEEAKPASTSNQPPK
jgi:hypothetical protein